MNHGVQPKISVLVPVYNREIFIGRCLRSLLHQSLGAELYEVICIDDGSNDRTRFALSLFDDPSSNTLKILQNESNLGLPTSLNRGLELASGQYIVRVDSDDYVNTDFLRFLLLFLELNPDWDAVACDYLLVDELEKVIRHVNCLEEPIGCGLMVNRGLIEALGGFNEEFLINEEREFRYRLEKIVEIHRVALPLYRYKRHPDNMTNQREKVAFFDEKLKDIAREE